MLDPAATGISNGAHWGRFREPDTHRTQRRSLFIRRPFSWREDIPLLIHFFMNQAAERHHKAIEGMAPEAQQQLMSFPWPGNVRQLKTTIENMVVLSSHSVLRVEDLPPDIRPAGGGATSGLSNVGGISLVEIEKEAIRSTLKMTKGNREQAAKILGIGERTLYRKIKEYGFAEGE